ncbi:RecQ family ATP-dependent DNA helicase [Candidatus Entotheonella palauensis]|uniref:RecQ family ATP-dependent DNA helicase n=1 Tax=Candidatus Entotheonella palauensis TaxID=93172 RepID=UPI0015C46DCE|nr:RecQ family ATP-dependent DNA helicase [Candidatus Entotheonella palauensis]
MAEHLEQVLRTQFGFDTFRPGQAEAIHALLTQRRVLCIQPTGYGKSLLYQLPAVLIDGITLVISPLLALMRDQLRHLNERFNLPAASINSDQSDGENDRAKADAISGRIRILFIAPEKLDNLDIYNFLRRLNVALLVVDEAHCISTWGHDFRPAYRQIVNAVHAFAGQRPDLHVLGLTATANQRTEQDIVAQLSSASEPSFTVLRSSMDRPNLRLSVLSTADMAHKLTLLNGILPDLEGSGILYCATRDNTELVADYLSSNGHHVVAYHAGYAPETKRALQQAFLDGQHKAIAATNALGMGIDKSDLRYVIHVDMPGSITAYYQEVGRAGRDGRPADGILLFDPGDRRIQDYFIRSAEPTATDFEQLLGAVEPDDGGGWPNLQTLKIRTGLHPTRVSVILAELVEQGMLEKRLQQRKQVYARLDVSKAPDLSRYERQRQVREAELDHMLRYAQGDTGCLMQTLRIALGEREAPACGHCGHCQPESVAARDFAPDTAAAQAWLLHRPVPIDASKRPLMSAGIALMDGVLRSAPFVQFMRHRAVGKDSTRTPHIPHDVQTLLAAQVQRLHRHHHFAAVVPIPSRTWVQREQTANAIAEQLGIPAYGDFLVWQDMPPHRQGELSNNDQRRENVRHRLQVNSSEALPASGSILLLDDYIGSGATLKEAVQTLRQKAGYSGEIVPLTLARVRWRLGASGMV